LIELSQAEALVRWLLTVAEFDGVALVTGRANAFKGAGQVETLGVDPANSSATTTFVDVCTFRLRIAGVAGRTDALVRAGFVDAKRPVSAQRERTGRHRSAGVGSVRPIAFVHI